MFGPICCCSQNNFSLKSPRRVQTLFWLWVSQCNFVWGGNSIKPSWEMKFLFHNLSWTKHWPRGPLYDLTLPLLQGRVKALWDSILNLCTHLTVSLDMKPQFCPMFLILSADQIPLSFAHPFLVMYQRCFFQEGTSLSVSFSLKVNSIVPLFESIWNLMYCRIPTISFLRWLISVAERLLPYHSCTDLPWKTSFFLDRNHLLVHPLEND